MSPAYIPAILLVSSVLGPGRDVPVPKSDAFAKSWEQVGFRHDLWSSVLAEHVDEAGLVDYRAVRSDARFREYLYRLANTNPEKVGDAKARLAFWINAYNALAIQGVLETLPSDPTEWPRYSVLDVAIPGVREQGKGFFRGLRFMIGGRRYTLDEIEQAMLLQKPQWVAEDAAFYRSAGVGRPDPRTHFALVCAAKGCVKLRREAYEAAEIDAQLDDAVRGFTRDRQRVVFDLRSRTMRISLLLDWYREDLTNPRYRPHAASVSEFLSRYVDDSELARSLAEDRWDTTYIGYDWKLNLQR
ncbi:MAG: DUF547 domain-containing protein [Phycisphaerales bacterium]|nr:MAG: DUF547 domain-containing protein [Phycisphaerales bacterium]